MADPSTKLRKMALLRSRRKRASRAELRGQKSHVEHLVALLPTRKSTRQQLVADFVETRQRFRRWLDQDEFGPSRKRHTEYLRELTKTVSTLRQQLAKGPPRLRAWFDTLLRDDGDPSDPVMHSFFGAVADVKKFVGVDGGSTEEREWIGQVQHSIEDLMARAQPDDNTDEEFVQAAWRYKFDVSQPTGHVFGLADFERWLKSYSNVLFQALSELNGRRGAQERVSLKLLVEHLCQVWENETGSSVTAHGIVEDTYTHRTETAAGRFVTAAVEAMLPDQSWPGYHLESVRSKRAATFQSGRKPARALHVLVIMRDFVKRRSKAAGKAVPKK
jgi:hypothetical protein